MLDSTRLLDSHRQDLTLLEEYSYTCFMFYLPFFFFFPIVEVHKKFQKKNRFQKYILVENIKKVQNLTIRVSTFPKKIYRYIHASYSQTFINKPKAPCN